MRLAMIAAVLGPLCSVTVSGQNLLQNGSFDHDLRGWTVHSDHIAVTWSADDADGSSTSGSAKVIMTVNPGAFGFVALTECLLATPGDSYTLSAKGRVIAGSYPYPAYVALRGYSAPDCNQHTETGGDGASLFVTSKDWSAAAAVGGGSGKPDMTVGKSAVAVGVVVTLQGADTGVEIDDVSVRRGTATSCLCSATVPLTAIVANTIVFTADVQGCRAARYNWTSTNGDATRAEPTFATSFAKAGTYAWILTAYDSTGAYLCSTTGAITVIPPPPRRRAVRQH